MHEPDLFADRAKRLFQFLSRAQQLKTPSVPTTDRYLRDGAVHWLHAIPVHPAVSLAGRDTDAADDGFVLSCRRVDKSAPPEPPEELEGWVVGDTGRPDADPQLRIERVVGREWDAAAERGIDQVERSEDRPDLHIAFDRWRSSWRLWAEQEAADAPVRDLYGQLFRTHVTAGNRAEDMEIIVGACLLRWNPGSGDAMSRHLLTMPLVGQIDDRSGTLTFSLDSSALGLAVEVDMIDPALIPSREVLHSITDAAADFGASPMDEPAIGDIARAFVNRLSAEGRYEATMSPAPMGDHPVVSWAPALILRNRTNTGLVAVFDGIAAEIEESGGVPEGLAPLVDPDRVPSTERDSSPGALFDVDGEIFSPLPLNEQQRRIIERVDRSAQTIVQGPPGTGKTHTAAALLSHLLAQGKRVLVTAHTDRALEEVRGKLPEQVRTLAVSVIGNSRAEMADLKVAVETIARKSVEHDRDEAAQSIRRSETEIEVLRRRRIELAEQLVLSRESETIQREHRGYTGTLAQIAQRLQEEAPLHEWIEAYVDEEATSAPMSVTNSQALRWLDLLPDDLDEKVEQEAAKRHVDRSGLPRPEEYTRLVALRAEADSAAEARVAEASASAGLMLRHVDSERRSQIKGALEDVVATLRRSALFPGAWVKEAVRDIRGGFPHVWQDRARSIGALVDMAAQHVDAVGLGHEIRISGNAAQVAALAENLREHVAASGTLKTHPDGTAKIGMFAAAPVKAARALLEETRVDGRSPVSIEQLDLLVQHLKAERVLADLDRSWPEGTMIPEEDTHRERLSWHTAQLRQLQLLIELADAIAATSRRLLGEGLDVPDWQRNESVEQYLRTIDAVEAQSRAAAAAVPLVTLAERLTAETVHPDISVVDIALREAVREDDPSAYANAWSWLDRLAAARERITEREELGATMEQAMSRLARAVRDDPGAAHWPARLGRLQQSWTWRVVGAWVVAQESLDANALQAQITHTEQGLRNQAETIAALRAWNHAVAPDRLTQGARADLTQYSQLVRRLGKGTGKYAAQQRHEIKQVMDRCRPAVPVWILPIYRLPDQLRMTQNMFDVVLVDEASQAGLDATFLQYLAPKIVVIGDDKQVSPSAVGVDREQLRKLADQYLYDDRYKASWQDPERSLFDDALMRFGGQITLVEHRRCVPEIIGFSNRIAYEPDNIRLLPVRQYGANRLEPIKAVHVDGVAEGASGNRVNRAEARALVDQLKRCLTDPRYDGKTFGVISLTGGRQAQIIETMLLEEVSAEEWSLRQLRVGNAPEFQGSERHVIFLSMVASWDPSTRIAALTREMYVQRYNVAVSRAQDQLWLFHSLSLEQVPRADDLRHQLLDYCYGIMRKGRDLAPGLSELVPEDVRVEPFDSLFEQRVHNRIVERGFTVVPQLEAQGYLIDLVVVGGAARLAVECDGDAWHGPDAYQRDLARQRELERCGWTFCRIRESEFYVDPARAMRGVWQALDTLDIRAFGDDVEDSDGAVPAPAPDDTCNDEVAGIAPPQPQTDEHEVPDRETPAHEASEPEAPTEMSDAEAERRVPRLDPYHPFRGSVPQTAEASPEQIAAGLIEIVRVEGPVLGHRLRSVYTRASGLRRQGPLIAIALERALAAAVQDGLMITENPLHAAGHADHTFRLPDQPRVRSRVLGERTLDEVPADELAVLLRAARESDPGATENERFRAVLAQLGRKALTGAALERLSIVSHTLLGPTNGDAQGRTGERADYVPPNAASVPSRPSPAASRRDDLMARELETFGPVIESFVAAHGRITRSEAAQLCGVEPEHGSALLRALVGARRLEMRGARRGSHYVMAGASHDPVGTGDSDDHEGKDWIDG